MTVTGRALPNSFVTLYLYSTPVVVTVKADTEGLWSYTFDLELPDGNHALYVAAIDAGGKIVAKSPAVPFFKSASAAAFSPLLMSETPKPDPIDSLRTTFFILAAAGATLFALIGIFYLGFRRGTSDVVSALA